MSAATSQADYFGYQDRHVVVTGCSSGIGQSTARILTELGARVTGLDIRTPDSDIADFVHVDMANVASIDAAVAKLPERIDNLFNCAGISSGAGPAELVIRINFLGLRCLTELIIPRMPEGAAIANVSSLDGYAFRAHFPLLIEFLAETDVEDAIAWWRAHTADFPTGGYAFSKQAMITYTIVRGMQLASDGIRMNSIGPGVTDTPILNDSKKLWGEGFLAKVPRPFGRMALPEEQAWPIVFLNSDLASHITAEHVCTDGGVANGMELGLTDREWFDSPRTAQHPQP